MLWIILWIHGTVITYQVHADMHSFWKYDSHKKDVKNSRAFGPKHSGGCFNVWGTWGSINSQCKFLNRSFNSTRRPLWIEIDSLPKECPSTKWNIFGCDIWQFRIFERKFTVVLQYYFESCKQLSKTQMFLARVFFQNICSVNSQYGFMIKVE